MKSILTLLLLSFILHLNAKQKAIKPFSIPTNETTYEAGNDTAAASSIIIEADKGFVFGRIYTGFYYGLNNNIKPRAAFGFSNGIIGYRHNFNGKIEGTI